MINTAETNRDFQKVMKFLEDNNEAVIDELRRENPKHEQIFSSYDLLFEGGEAPKRDVDKALKIAQLNGISKMLPVLIAKAERKIEELAKKLKSLRQYQFASKIITLISGSAILITLIATAPGPPKDPISQENPPKTAANNEPKEEEDERSVNYYEYIAPTLVLLSSILTLVYDHQIKDYLGGDKQEQAKRLIEHKSEAMTLLNFDIDPLKEHFVAELADGAIKRAADLITSLDKLTSK